MAKLTQTATLRKDNIEIEQRFYQPVLLWGYFWNWIQKTQVDRDKNDSDCHLLIFTKSKPGAYWMHIPRLFWKEDVSVNNVVGCDQDELWKNRDDLGEVQARVYGNPPTNRLLQWTSFNEFIEEVCEIEKI